MSSEIKFNSFHARSKEFNVFFSSVTSFPSTHTHKGLKWVYLVSCVCVYKYFLWVFMFSSIDIFSYPLFSLRPCRCSIQTFFCYQLSDTVTFPTRHPISFFLYHLFLDFFSELLACGMLAPLMNFVSPVSLLSKPADVKPNIAMESSKKQ